MSTFRIKATFIVLLAVCAIVGAAAWRPSLRLADTRPRVDLETLFPKQFGEWRDDDRMPIQLVSPDTQAMLSKIYNQTLTRTYINGAGERIMLSVAYGGDQSDATRAHRPEVCYPAQGFEIISRGYSRISLGDYMIPVRRFVARQGSRNEPLTYWITVGDHVTTTGTQQKLTQLSYSTRGFIPDGMLVRVSSIGTDIEAAFRLQNDFVGAMLKSIPTNKRSLVGGKAEFPAGSSGNQPRDPRDAQISSSQVAQ